MFFFTDNSKIYTHKKYSKQKNKRLSKLIAITIASLWTALMIGSIAWNYFLIQNKATAEIYELADAAIKKDLTYRRFISNVGGVYIPVAKGIEPNDSLSHIKDRDIQTPNGVRLTLVNSTYFMRMVYEQNNSDNFFIQGKVAALKPLNADNKADLWEQNAIENLHNGKDVYSSIVDINGQAYFRMARARRATDKCLQCHLNTSYNTGDVLGVVSISIPMAPFMNETNREVILIVSGLSLLWVFGLIFISISYRYISSQEARLHHQAYHDSLTGLPNRNMLYENLTNHFHNNKEPVTHGALCLIDLDRFKNINDSLGHHVGDELLKQVAKIFSRISSDNDFVARMGGDEFVILLPELAEDYDLAIERIKFFLTRLKISLTKNITINNHSLHAGISVGVAMFPEHGNNASTILKHADTAMYRAKSNGRSSYEFYLPELQEKIDEQVELEAELNKAIELNQFELYYQPQVNQYGKIIGAETLIRWFHPTKGNISPEVFIPIAEENGMIIKIGDWVMETAIAQIRQLSDSTVNLNNFTISVNVSSQQFYRTDFANKLLTLIETAEIEPSLLKLEITETAIVDDFDIAIKTMNLLRTYGILFSLDDFGTGYSSLSYLQKLPLDQLKIDRSFITDIYKCDNKAAIVETIISMSKILGISVIAEGMEEMSQFIPLKTMGCKFYQGFMFYRPLEFNDFIEHIIESPINLADFPKVDALNSESAVI